jgi:nucleoside-triphosphatase THEP1
MIYILTDKIETGKSKALLIWTEGRADVFGILSPRNNLNQRYFLNVGTGEAFKMEASDENEDIILVGRYNFLQSAFDKANDIIKNSAENTRSGFILIDEIGKLELRSEGLHESASIAITTSMHQKDLHTVLIVRTSLIDAVIKKYKIINPKLITRDQLSSSFIE